LELLQKFPYKKVIESLKQKLLEEFEVSQNVILPKAEVNFKHGAIFINDVEIISKEAENLYKIFRIFLINFSEMLLQRRIAKNSSY
jgi:hypothetical protein